MASPLDGSTTSTDTGGPYGSTAGGDGAVTHGSPVSIVSDRLTSSNYRTWAQAMLRALAGCGKLAFVNGTSVMPDDLASPQAVQWQMDDALVGTWLINSMAPNLKPSFLYLPTAREIWVAACDSYGDEDDHSRFFEVHRQSWHYVQESRDVTEYWLELQALWHELDVLEVDEWETAGDVAHAQKKLNKERVMIFLAGLNVDFDAARSRVLSRRTFPPVREVFIEMRRDESGRAVMLPENPPTHVNHSAFAGKGPTGSLNANSSPSINSSQATKPVCEHCHK